MASKGGSTPRSQSGEPRSASATVAREPNLLQPPTGVLHHDRREIDGNARRLGERFEKALQEDSISRPEVQNARRKPVARPNDPNQHFELSGSVGYDV